MLQGNADCSHKLFFIHQNNDMTLQFKFLSYTRLPGCDEPQVLCK